MRPSRQTSSPWPFVPLQNVTHGATGADRQQPVDPLGQDRARLLLHLRRGGSERGGRGCGTTSAGPSGTGNSSSKPTARQSIAWMRASLARCSLAASMRRSSSAGSALARNGQAPVAVDLGPDVGRPAVGLPGRIVFEPEGAGHRHRRRRQAPIHPVLDGAAAPGRPMPTSWSRRTTKPSDRRSAPRVDRASSSPRLAGTRRGPGGRRRAPRRRSPRDRRLAAGGGARPPCRPATRVAPRLSP